MTKGELRKARKQAKENGQNWNIELDENGHPQQVRERTKAQERKHQDAMYRWARWNYENDRD
jgi:hypothetical protein